MLLPVLPGPETISGKYMKKVRPRRKFFKKIYLAPFLQNSAKIQPQILPANFCFLRPLLSFLAGILATWQH
jgi:hypothetical protein